MKYAIEPHSWEETIEVLDAAGDDTLATRLWVTPPMHRYVSGRYVVIGDAAHAMTPFLGHGAACAIEDAVVLARCLHDVLGPTTLLDASPAMVEVASKALNSPADGWVTTTRSRTTPPPSGTSATGTVTASPPPEPPAASPPSPPQAASVPAPPAAATSPIAVRRVVVISTSGCELVRVLPCFHSPRAQRAPSGLGNEPDTVLPCGTAPAPRRPTFPPQPATQKLPAAAARPHS